MRDGNRRRLIGAALAALAFLAVGCTEGPGYSETSAARAPVPAGKGRIAVLRTQQVMGFGVKPIILVDGLPTGKCEVNSVFYVDVPPGTHTVSASAMEASVVRVPVSAGQTAYVLCTIEASAMVGQPKLTPVSASSVAPVLGGMVFTGQYQP